MIDNIKTGAFSTSGPEWEDVSELAKEVISGLLTVNTSQRLTIDSLSQHSWLEPLSAPATLLHTNHTLRKPGVTKQAINHTFKAFHKASEAGFSLGDPNHAPLAQKRKNKHWKSPRPALNEDEEEVRSGGRPTRLPLSHHRT